MMNETFDFYEAMQNIDFGETVSLEHEGKTRYYFRNSENILMCKIGNTEYPVKHFYLDAIESKNWRLCE